MRPIFAHSLLAGVIGLVACSDVDRGGSLEIDVSPTPATVGPAQIRVSVADSLQVPAATRVVLTGGLGDGAGQAVVDTATAVRPGLWVVDSFPFPGAGIWLLDARAELPDGRTLRGSHRIRVVGR